MADPVASDSAAPAPRRSSRISAQAKPEAPVAKGRKGASASASGSAATNEGGSKTTGTGRKRSLKEEKEEDVAEHDAKKAKIPSGPSGEETQGADEAAADQDMTVEESAPVAGTSSAPSEALQPIDIGSSLPSLVLKNEKGEDVDTASIAAEKGVVLFLVPKADTPGCTTQACHFRDVWEEFGAINYDVYCLSADSPTAQTKWQTKKQLPYQLLSDPQRRLIGALGAADGNKTKRSHFVFEKGGKMIDKKIPVKPADSSRLALEFIKGLNN